MSDPRDRRWVSFPVGFWSYGWLLHLSPVAIAVLFALQELPGARKRADTCSRTAGRRRRHRAHAAVQDRVGDQLAGQQQRVVQVDRHAPGADRFPHPAAGLRARGRPGGQPPSARQASSSGERRLAGAVGRTAR
jgi:hypothetical protein